MVMQILQLDRAGLREIRDIVNTAIVTASNGVATATETIEGEAEDLAPDSVP